MRTLASVQRISHLEPIPEAENIQKATVLGWSVVVKKQEFKVGDLCAPLEEKFDLDLGRLSFKAVNPEFLLSYGE